MNKNEILNGAWRILTEVRTNFPEYRSKLEDAVVKLNRRMTAAAGRATRCTNTIELSVPIFSDPQNESGFKNTVLHEIAHLLSPTRGHSQEWRKIHLLLGGDGSRCHRFRTIKRNTTKYSIFCSVCGEEMKVGKVRYNKIKRGVTYRHRGCRNSKMLISKECCVNEIFI